MIRTAVVVVALDSSSVLLFAVTSVMEKIRDDSALF